MPRPLLIDKDLTILKLVKIKNYSIAKAGRELGVHKSMAHRRYHRANKMLQNGLIQQVGKRFTLSTG